jgi:hypothetical protein
MSGVFAGSSGYQLHAGEVTRYIQNVLLAHLEVGKVITWSFEQSPDLWLPREVDLVAKKSDNMRQDCDLTDVSAIVMRLLKDAIPESKTLAANVGSAISTEVDDFSL